MYKYIKRCQWQYVHGRISRSELQSKCRLTTIFIQIIINKLCSLTVLICDGKGSGPIETCAIYPKGSFPEQMERTKVFLQNVCQNGDDGGDGSVIANRREALHCAAICLSACWTVELRCHLETYSHIHLHFIYLGTSLIHDSMAVAFSVKLAVFLEKCALV